MMRDASPPKRKAGAPVSAPAFLLWSPRPRASVLSLLLPLLALAACTTRALAPHGRPALGDTPLGVTSHGYVDGELVLRFTSEGERAVAPSAGQPPGRLRFGVASLDRLNAKYHASALLPLAGERGVYRIRLARDANVFRAAEEYGRDPLVREAEPNYLFRIDRPAEEPGAVRTQVR